jgi:hypothetical protein
MMKRVTNNSTRCICGKHHKHASNVNTCEYCGELICENCGNVVEDVMCCNNCSNDINNTYDLFDSAIENQVSVS